jgi:hypothetical protein
MWEALVSVLTSANAAMVLIFVLIMVVICLLLLKRGFIQINTKSFRLGADERERDIIRQQVEWAHTYIMGLQVNFPTSTDCRGYFLKYLLEKAYSEVVDWITFNHMRTDGSYIPIKQDKIKSMVFSLDISPEYATDEYRKKIDEWVDELIRKLILIREDYK